LAIDNEKFGGAIGVRVRGADVLRDPLLNKGTGFSAAERQGLRIEGLLPFKSVSQEQQAARIYEQLQAQPDPLQKYLLLSALQNRNAHLFYRLLGDHLEELMPIVYTPTVGTATQRFSRVFQGGGGVWITPDMHRIHHSQELEEEQSNFGEVFPWWDRLFGTYCAEPAAGQEGLITGLKGLRSARSLNVGFMLTQPFAGQAAPLTDYHRDQSL